MSDFGQIYNSQDITTKIDRNINKLKKENSLPQEKVIHNSVKIKSRAFTIVEIEKIANND